MQPLGKSLGHASSYQARLLLGSMLGSPFRIRWATVRAALPSKTRTGPRLVLQPASRRAARHTSTSALKRFFAIADAWELSPLQQCRLLKIPSPQVLQRYRLGQAPRLSATQQERAALIANIQFSLMAEAGPKDRAWAWVHPPASPPPSHADTPLNFIFENALPPL